MIQLPLTKQAQKNVLTEGLASKVLAALLIILAGIIIAVRIPSQQRPAAVLITGFMLIVYLGVNFFRYGPVSQSADSVMMNKGIEDLTGIRVNIRAYGSNVS